MDESKKAWALNKPYFDESTSDQVPFMFYDTEESLY